MAVPVMHGMSGFTKTKYIIAFKGGPDYGDHLIFVHMANNSYVDQKRERDLK